jgi:23S rRNA pseudouridine1911/1915/1917 synthase
MDIKILSETKDYIVLIKPAGLTVHGGQGITEATLADWIIEKYPQVKGVGENEYRPGIMHRLDKEVSGLMVIALNQTSYESLKEQFKDRDIIKRYTALVHGELTQDAGTINFPIKRAARGFKMAAVPNSFPVSDKVKEAQTDYDLINKNRFYSLIKVKTKTGRTHQIRVHFFSIGHPLVGDHLYYTKASLKKDTKHPLGRVFLMADELEFKDLEGEKQSFNIGLDKPLKDFLKSHI